MALLAITCMVPVLAFGAESQSEETAVVETPNSEQLEAAMQEKEAELAASEERFEEELATPAAEQERERSRTEYSGVDASEASTLLMESFAPAIQQLNEDPGRLLTAGEVEVEEMLGPNAARVSSPEDGREIIESSQPLESSVGGTAPQPVDLTLERTGGSFSPANPTTPTELPASAEGAIEIGEGLRIQIPTTGDHEAVQVGQMSLFYPETEEATDTMVAPVAGGVEVYNQLRSAESPEGLRFAVEVPAGDRLISKSGGNGAEVVDSEGSALTEIPPPSAVDAQGAAVPTTMRVEGESLVVEVELAATEPAYPVLVDPSFLEEPTSFGEWSPSESPGSEYGYNQTGSSLELWSLGSFHNYGPFTHIQYAYASPGPTAWIEAATFRSIYFFNNSCGGEQPHGYIGLYNPGGGSYEALREFKIRNTTATPFEYQTGWVAHPGTEWAIFGLGTGGSGTSLSCVHEFWLGNYSLQEKDTTLPVVTSVSGVPINQWFDPAKVGNAVITAADSGFGVYEISAGVEGAVTNRVRPNNCTGVSGGRCPHEFSWEIPPAYAPGKRAFLANAQDAMGNKTSSGFSGWTYADPYKPEIELTGQFAKATQEVGFSNEGAHDPADENKLSLPTYELHMSAIDGSNATPQTMQSGVQRVQVFLDGKEQSLPWGTQTCPAAESSCGLSGNFTLQLLALTAGIHKLKVVATDRVGLVREREIEFEFIPATGDGENQVLERFPLPDGEGGSEGDEESSQPEIAVNVTNGNLVFHQQDAEVATSNAGLGIERFYNSELPQTQSGEFGRGWTLGETPELEVGGGGGSSGQATVVEGDGALETAVPLPTLQGQSTFDPATHDLVEKAPQGFTVTDESVEAEAPADLTSSGIATDLQGAAEATLDYERKGGELSELAVDDPATASGKAEQAGTESTRGILFQASKGGVNSEGGTLSHPVATATDSSGNVYVADAGHDRVQVFDEKGAFLRQWGGAGSGNGAFSNMVGIAVIGANVYVAEPTRIEEFSVSGDYLRQWGTAGGGNGQFTELAAISADSTGHLWALDRCVSGCGFRAQEFSAEGQYITKAQFASGSGSGQVSFPRGIAVDNAGNIYLADTGNSRIVEYAPSGALVRQLGSAGSGPGLQFSGPAGIAIGGSGVIWVADTGNNRVEEIFPSGATRQRGTPGANETSFSEPLGIGIDPGGNAWVADRMNDRIDKWTEAGVINRNVGGTRTVGGRLLHPVATATDSSGNVYVADGGHDRVQVFNEKGEFVRQWGGAGGGNGAFNNLVGIAVIGSNVFVAEPSRIEEFNVCGDYLRQWGTLGGGNGQFTELAAITADSTGHLWALDRCTSTCGSRAQEFSTEGKYMTKVEFAFGSGAGQVIFPRGIGIDKTGNFFLADTGNSRVMEFGPSGAFLRQIGSAGTAPGLFSLPTGIAVDATGNVWVTDTGNDRIEKFSATGTPIRQPGNPGSGTTQFSEPLGIAVDPAGNIWVADRMNDRLDKWTENGVILLNIGSANSEGGILSRPVATATDLSGNVYVADAGHDRVQEFDEKGEFVRQWGGAGYGNGMFSNMVGIAVIGGHVYVAEPSRIEEFSTTGVYLRQWGSMGGGSGQFTELAAITADSTGHLWALDQCVITCGGRAQEFSSEGKYLTKIEFPNGSGSGQVASPSGMAIDKTGDFFLSDARNSRVMEFGPSGAFVRQIGSAGTGTGQFSGLGGIAIDGTGNVWVADTGNHRMQLFSSTGKPLARFGRMGGDPGQFSQPSSIAVDGHENLWVADSMNDRIENWKPSELQPTPPPIEPAPSAAVTTSAGLVQAIAGNATGTISYQHTGTRLTEVAGPEATTHYQYASQERLSKVELPNRTWAGIVYDSLGRVASLFIVIEGGPVEKTTFEYSGNPRETVVRRPSKPATRYSIGENGEVVKWWNVPKPPEIEQSTGSLWAQRMEVHPQTITIGDQSLEVKATSPEGIASIQIVADGAQVVAEKHCEKEHAFECTSLERIYVTETQNWTPGIHSFEAVVTDANNGTSSLRFSDNFPYTPPPGDGELEPPTFEQMLRFREEFGLDLDLKGNERALDERIFNLIDAWHEPGTPEGQVARASSQRWGVPLRAIDVAELEYRERYAAEAAHVIPQWAEGHAQASYAGYYINQRQGGIIHVGFAAGNQSQLVGQMVSEIGSIAPGRISSFESQPQYSLPTLVSTWHSISSALVSRPDLEEAFVAQGLDTAANKVNVETSNVAGTEAFLNERIGGGAFEVSYAAQRPAPDERSAPEERPAEHLPPPKRTREADGRLFSGDGIYGNELGATYECTLGWGAVEPTGQKPNGQITYEKLGVIAGHCFGLGSKVFRIAKRKGEFVEFPIGTVTRRTWNNANSEGFEVDAEAFTLNSSYSPPSWIWTGPQVQLRTGSPEVPHVGEIVCHSGVNGGYTCAPIAGLKELHIEGTTYPTWEWDAPGLRTHEGDSGGPVWNVQDNAPVGMVSAGGGYFTALLEATQKEDGVVIGRTEGAQGSLSHGALQFVGG